MKGVGSRMALRLNLLMVAVLVVLVAFRFQAPGSDERREARSEKREARSEKREAGSERREAGSERREAGSERREAGSGKREARSEKREAGSERREARSEKREAGRERREAGSERREARSEKREAGSERREAGSEKREAGRERREAGSEKREAGSERRAISTGHNWTPDTGHRTPDDCFACHDDDTFTMEREGREISIFVDPTLYDESVHGGLDCVDCHADYDPDEDPHTPTPQKVDCSTCHEDSSREYALSAHSGETDCASCHTNVHTPTGTMASETVCADCHEESVAEIAMSAHAGNDVAPTCLTCHSSHKFELADSQTCLTCHGEREFVHEHIVHEDVEAVLAYEESIHGGIIECADCHAGHLILPSDDPRSAVSRTNMAATCAECHEDAAAEFASSEHGIALAEGFEFAPSCTDCHGEHDIHQIGDPESPISRVHEAEICLSCHLDSEDVQERMTHTGGFIAGFELSVHGRAMAGGNLEAAVCSDCHGAHKAMKSSDRESPTNIFSISATCGNCHEEAHEVFEESIHGEALADGIADAPTCTTCHSEHDILATDNPESPVAVVNVSQEVCAPCHESAALSEKYGFPSDRTASFADSYHGLAGRSGDAESANCSSCHGIHDIWPSSDPRSRVHPTNIETTCGSCHPGANANFAQGSVHISREPDGNTLLYWITTIYVWAIVILIGSMTVHNTMDWTRKAIVRYQSTTADVPHARPAAGRQRFYLRMTSNERIQHAVLAVSFILLVITGFMLRFPEAWWVVGLRNLFGQAVFDLRGLLHRIAAVAMVAVGLYHAYYAAFTQRGRQLIKDLWFSKKDFKDLVQMIKYYLGRTPDRPLFDRFNYIEKSEYWALVWGTVVMTVTGFALWFENHFMSTYSKLFVDVNETIHYYEAWLAFLAIVVWHFYYVIFNPDVYPMNFTWLTGKVSEAEMEHEHPLELDRIRRQQSGAVEPPSEDEDGA